MFPIRSIKLSAASMTFIGDIALRRKEVFSRIVGSTRPSSHCSRGCEVNRGPKPEFRHFAVKDYFTVSSPLEFLKNELVHFRAISMSAGGNDGERTAFLGVSCRGENCLVFQGPARPKPPVIVPPLFPSGIVGS